MDALVYILLFSSSILIIIETWSIYAEIRQRRTLDLRLRLIHIDTKAIEEIDVEQYQKMLKILDTIEVCDIEPTAEIEELLRSYKNIHERMNKK